MTKYREANTWIDEIDRQVLPYVDAPEWENRYPTLSAMLMKVAEKHLLQDTSAALVVALSRLVEALRTGSGKMPFNLLNMTDKLTPYILGDAASCVSYISRLDYVKDASGCYKLMEINSDTPCALPETFMPIRLPSPTLAGCIICSWHRARTGQSWQSRLSRFCSRGNTQAAS